MASQHTGQGLPWDYGQACLGIMTGLALGIDERLAPGLRNKGALRKRI